MIRIISHRANITGPNTASSGENNPNSILYALSLGFDVEVDVWFDAAETNIEKQFWLGHDKPTFTVNPEFFYNDCLWVHCKNIEAVYKLKSNPLIRLFWHQTDCISLVSNGGLLWTYPDAKTLLTPDSVAVMPEKVGVWEGISQCYGVCTDYPTEYKKDINFRRSDETI